MLCPESVATAAVETDTHLEADKPRNLSLFSCRHGRCLWRSRVLEINEQIVSDVYKIRIWAFLIGLSRFGVENTYFAINFFALASRRVRKRDLSMMYALPLPSVDDNGGFRNLLRIKRDLYRAHKRTTWWISFVTKQQWSASYQKFLFSSGVELVSWWKGDEWRFMKRSALSTFTAVKSLLRICAVSGQFCWFAIDTKMSQNHSVDVSKGWTAELACLGCVCVDNSGGLVASYFSIYPNKQNKSWTVTEHSLRITP